MKDKYDELLLESFFSEARSSHLADNGFTDAVMRRIEAQANRRIRMLSWLWTAVCTIAGVVFTIYYVYAYGLNAGDLSALSALLLDKMHVYIAALPGIIDGIRNLPPYVLLLPVAASGIIGVTGIIRYNDI